MVKSKGERISNAIINGISFPISLIMMIILIISSNNVIELLFSIFISIGIMSISLFNTLYYSLDSILFKKFSYISFITDISLLLIYLCLCNISIISWVIFGLSIGFLIINILFECIEIEWFKYIKFTCNLLLLFGFIILGFWLSIKSILFISINCFLIMIMIFYYLYDTNIFMHYLLSVILLLININILLFLFI